MGLFDNLSTDSDINEESDYLGGSRVLDSDVYLFNVDKAYVVKSAKEAMGLALELSCGKQILRQTVYMTSGKEKGCKNYYIDKRTNEKAYLPGFNLANALCLLTVGKAIKDLDTEKKVIPLYDYDAKKDIPTEVDMLSSLIGTKFYAGVIKEVVDKRKKNDSTGDYEPTGETQTRNDLDKIFCAKEGFEHFTLPEVRAKATEAVFMEKWLERWKGQEKNNTTKTDNNGTPGAPQAAGTSAPVGDLFT